MSTPENGTSGDDYVGEPNYPAPWTTHQPKEGLRDIDAARIVCLAPDVCLTPIGDTAVPIPYQIVDYAGHDAGYAESVRFTGKKVMTLASRTTHVHGDAPGTKKGVKSGTVEDVAEPIGHAPEVRAEGQNVIRHLDRFHMNSRNTVGEAIYVKDTAGYEPPVDDDPVPGSLFMVTVTPAQMEQPVQQQQQNAGAATAGQSIPSTRPAPQPVPRTIPITGLRRRGLLGLLLQELAQDLTASPEERAAEARAMQAIFSPYGNSVIKDKKLLAGREKIGAFSDLPKLFSPSTWQSKYGVIIGPEDRIPLANDILSEAAGRPMDVRTMSDQEVRRVLSQAHSDEGAGENVRVAPAEEHEVECFEVSDKYDRQEYEDQLQKQEDELNKLSPEDYLQRRQDFKDGTTVRSGKPQRDAHRAFPARSESAGIPKRAII